MAALADRVSGTVRALSFQGNASLGGPGGGLGAGLAELLPVLPRLERLDLGGCGLADAGSLPAELWRCPALRSLELSGNALTRVPEDVRHLTALESLGLADNRLDALPGPALSVLPRLNTLSLHGNPALVAASPSLRAALHGSLASSVRAPELLGAWLSDRPEESMAHAAMLRRLRVRAEEKSAGGNAAEEEKEKKSAGGEAREKGATPAAAAEKAAGTDVPALDLAECGLERVPRYVVNPERGAFLLELSLKRNALTAVPSEIAVLRRLRRLDLAGNRLAAPGVPDALDTLAQLLVLDLSDNRLEEVPRTVATRLPLCSRSSSSPGTSSVGSRRTSRCATPRRSSSSGWRGTPSKGRSSGGRGGTRRRCYA